MNKNDAKVYKALAEAGFQVGKEISDEEVEYIMTQFTNEDAIFYDDIIALFSDDPSTETQEIREKLNKLLK